jgi:chemotaxis protein histidine kinase CheA
VERFGAAGWDGSGAFGCGEVEDYLLHRPAYDFDADSDVDWAAVSASALSLVYSSVEQITTVRNSVEATLVVGVAASVQVDAEVAAAAAAAAAAASAAASTSASAAAESVDEATVHAAAAAGASAAASMVAAASASTEASAAASAAATANAEVTAHASAYAAAIVAAQASVDLIVTVAAEFESFTQADLSQCNSDLGQAFADLQVCQLTALDCDDSLTAIGVAAIDTVMGDWTGANFTGMNLENANFTNANLQNADFTGANTNGCVWTALASN